MNEIICFHQTYEENGYLSNWYESPFTIEGINFSSVEQYMMYKKAIVFKNYDIAKEILNTKDPASIKELGRSVTNYDDKLWSGIRQIIVYEGLYQKFSQNEELKSPLKNTKDSILAECAVNDLIWGIGLSMTDPNRFDPNKWKGKNLLGYTLMMVRDNI